MKWRSIRDGLIFTVLVLSIVCLVTSVATMVLVIARIQSKEKEDFRPEVCSTPLCPNTHAHCLRFSVCIGTI